MVIRNSYLTGSNRQPIVNASGAEICDLDHVRDFRHVHGGNVNHRQFDVHTFPNDRISQYPAYKNSGIEWLGRIPAHWEVSATNRLDRVVNGLEMLDCVSAGQ